jgi:hypothetical protein
LSSFFPVAINSISKSQDQQSYCRKSKTKLQFISNLKFTLEFFLKSLIFLWLLVSLSPFASVADLPLTSAEQKWIACIYSNRFEPLTKLPKPFDQTIPYFQARGVSDEKIIEDLICTDLLHMAHGLSLLFEQDQTNILQNYLGDYFFLLEGCNAKIDHVGKELLGPLSFYLPLLKKMAPKLNLIYLRDLVFPSTQVVKILQQDDSTLQGVTIGRAYFQSPETGAIGCLELFQAAPLDEKKPQNIQATQERISLLSSSNKNSPLSPIDHISIELSRVEQVQKIHENIHKLASETLKPNQKEISHNPGDGSTQTKVLLRNSKEASYNKIIEFVHYKK